MLKSIDIKNFALINSVRLNFCKGLNILIGETGAGKSVIIDALLQSLGERTSSDFVRTGTLKAIVESEFQLNRLHPAIEFLRINDIEINDYSIVTRREISSKGTSRCFINDNQVQVSLLKAFGELLADFHGQHDNQILLKPDNHLKILDEFANLYNLVKEYSEEYLKLNNLINSHKSLLKNERESSEKLNQLKTELNELQKINPQPDEDVIIGNELSRIENSETLFRLTEELLYILDESDSSVSKGLNHTLKLIDSLAKLDTEFMQYSDETNASIISINDIINFIGNYKSKIIFDTDRIDELRHRITKLKGLEKKYGSINLAIDRTGEIRAFIDIIEHYDEKLKVSAANIITHKKSLGKLANRISELRKNAASTLEKGIESNLNNLGLENSNFEIKFEHDISDTSDLTENTATISGKEYICNTTGIDNISFFISTNIGEEPKPLIQVASGGELSRLMLAIKSVIAESEQTPLLVFDEIDTGISGRIAAKVGQAIKELSASHQVIAITHIPQIAVQADKLISVFKSQDDNTAAISAREETDETKSYEIAKLISADKVTETSIKNINELLNLNNQVSNV